MLGTAKRTTSCLMAIVLTLCFMLATFTGAATAAGDAFQVEKTKVEVGETFVVSFTQPQTLTLSSLTLKIGFDKDAFEITTIAKAPYADVQPGIPISNQDGETAISYADKTNDANTTIVEGTELLNVTFKVKDTATIGDKIVKINLYEVTGEYDELTYTLIDITPDEATVGAKTKTVTVVPPVVPVDPVIGTPVAATPVTVGDALSASTLSGTFKNADDEEVAGTLAWTDPATVVSATGDFDWAFTPTDTEAYNSITGTVNVVANPAPAVTSVTVTPAESVVNRGETKKLTATVTVVSGATQTVNWSSSGASGKVTVDQTGLVTVAAGAVEGNYTITATSTFDGTKKGTATITVLPLANLAGLTISEGTLKPAFDPNVYSYTASVANSVKSITIVPEVVVDHNQFVATGGGTFPLDVGDNTFKVRVVGANGTDPAEYTIVITRKTASTGGGGGGGGVVAPTVTGIEIKAAPDKVSYDEGDKLDLTGLEVTVTYSDGKTKDIAAEDFAKNGITVSPKAGEVLDADVTAIEIKADGKTVKQVIVVDKKDIVTPQDIDKPVEKPVLTDIDGHWAEDYIEYLVGIGAISGYPDGTFRPDAPITRAEFAKVIVDAFELKGSGKVFDDTADHWAKNYVAIAAANGIVLGYNENEFGPDDLITREQMAIIIVKAAGLKEQTGVLDFIDEGNVSSWAYNWVVSAVDNNLMSGYEDNSFKPLNNATRAEAATVIYNILMK